MYVLHVQQATSKNTEPEAPQKHGSECRKGEAALSGCGEKTFSEPPSVLTENRRPAC